MKKLYEELRKVILNKLLSGEFVVVDRSQYTVGVLCFDEDFEFYTTWWIANEAESFKTYDDSCLRIRFFEEEKELQTELYNKLRFGEGNIKPVVVDRLSNDLFFKVDGKTILTGYGDDYWWENVAPKCFAELNIKRIDGTLYQFPKNQNA